ncbi:MAG: hypothetical protein ACD_3C00154G0006 [uncultured bacterium (gcode 4)]|uniref:CYTH domain-containing protein n=1 Tax=uncultured bacterium (gcode 4) TaxID=1234023 RepID=K2FXP9_9BACT|nr:MAG: hypothetical protein ACD_3C00154G0006 [uncultured bacterium (gcode 4)]
MQEIEVKIFEIDKDFLIGKIKKLWAEKIFEGEIVADFYINDAGKKIRLRRAAWENIMTYKEKITVNSIMENLEYEIIFDKYENLCNTLECIWFNKYWNSSKYRIGYRLWNIIYDFDKYEWIPWFVEVESDNHEDVIKWVEILWYCMEDTNALTERLVKEHYWVV